MELTATAKAILEKRYLLKDLDGNLIESVHEMLHRVATAISKVDERYGETAEDVSITKELFYNMMQNKDFLPNSPTLMNAGLPDGQLSACFVLPIEDSMEGIFNTLKHAALIHKTGGGTGFSFSRLRPASSPVQSTGGVASGPISFMQAYNAATETVKQGGKRRGANMGLLRVDHPDIVEFINCKQDLTKLTNFNISVGITDAFMRALDADSTYNIIDPSTGEIVGSKVAKEVWDNIIKNAWQTGEPGIVFIDEINRDNITPNIGDIEATNPCGEQPLLPYGSCNLGSINLANMVYEKYPEERYEVDYDKLGKTVEAAVHFLDNVIDANCYPLDEIDTVTKATRNIGLGVMGWADLLIKLKIPYNSPLAIDKAHDVMRFIQTCAYEASEKLAEKRGVFPAWEDSLTNRKIRNAAITTIAPTGTISAIAGVSSGIEPVFAFAFEKRIMDDEVFIEMHPLLEEAIAKYIPEECHKAVKAGICRTGKVSLEHIPPEVAKYFTHFICAYQVSPIEHVEMQAAFQRNIDNAISKTINFPKEATVEDFDTVYRAAFTKLCKGVTAYRDGSRDNQVLTAGIDTAATKETFIGYKPRPDVLHGRTDKVHTGCGNLYVTVNQDNEGIVEILTNSGKTGGCNSQAEATARLITLALRSGISYEAIAKQLKGIRCPAAIRNPKSNCMSCPDAIAMCLQAAIKHKQNDEISSKSQETNESAKCPVCDAPLVHEEGCVKCINCVYSKCN